MRKSFKTALCIILGVCFIAALLAGCAQAGNERALGPNNGLNNGTNNRLNSGTQNQGLNRNNLVGGRYGNNRNNSNNGNYGYTGMYGTNRRNMAGGDGNTGNDPSNFLSNNGINTIDYNNRFSRMGNNGTGAGNNGMTGNTGYGYGGTGYGNGYNGMLTGNTGYGNGNTGYGNGYNGMLTGNNGFGNGNTGYGNGYNGMLTGNNGFGNGNTGYGNGYNGMLTGNNGTNAMNGNDRYRASMIERQLENVNGINDCSVIVSGDTALVGLNTNGTNAGNMSRLRTSIERRVRQMDNSIRNVKVTDSPDMLTRMGRLGTTGNNNGTTNNFMQEFDNMMNSLNNTRR